MVLRIKPLAVKMPRSYRSVLALFRSWANLGKISSACPNYESCITYLCGMKFCVHRYYTRLIIRAGIRNLTRIITLYKTGQVSGPVGPLSIFTWQCHNYNKGDRLTEGCDILTH